MNIEKGIVMTQTELEQIARHLRDIGLHASWSELMVLADSVVGNLVDVYQTLARNSLASNDVSLTLDNNVYMTLQDKLSKAIVTFDLFCETCLASQGWPVRATPDPCNNVGYGRMEKEHDPRAPQQLDVGVSRYDAPAGVQHLPVARCKMGNHLRFEIAEVVPGVLLHDFRDAASGATDDFLVEADQGHPEGLCDNSPNSALAGPAVADQNEIHQLRLPSASRTDRSMVSTGAEPPVQSSNWMAA